MHLVALRTKKYIIHCINVDYSKAFISMLTSLATTEMTHSLSEYGCPDVRVNGKFGQDIPLIKFIFVYRGY